MFSLDRSWPYLAGKNEDGAPRTMIRLFDTDAVSDYHEIIRLPTEYGVSAAKNLRHTEPRFSLI